MILCATVRQKLLASVFHFKGSLSGASVCVCVTRSSALLLGCAPVPPFTVHSQSHTHPKSFPLDRGEVLIQIPFVDATFEFPFAASLPVREKSKLAQLWEELRDMREASRERGVAVPIASAAVLLGVSRQRIDQLVADGRFNPVELHGRKFICEDDITEFAKSERATGRPVAFPDDVAGCWKRAVAAGRVKNS